MRAIVLTVGVDETEVASDALWSLGVVAVEERSGADGSTELWTSLGDDAAAIAEAVAVLGDRWPCMIVDVDERVADSWRDHATPTWVTEDLVVCPAWIDLEVHDGVTALRIEPGSTFGIGDHPTTVESLRALRRHVRPGDRVLDVGCGSGVLAIGAIRFGAASAQAIDISPAAVPTTLDNAARNGVSDLVAVSTTPLGDVVGTFDVVVANILAPALVELAPDLKRVLDDDGVLIVSGLLADRHDHVVAALAPLRLVERDESGGWVALSLRR